MPKYLTIPCGNCGIPVTGLAAGISQRLMQNTSGQIYCPACRQYGGLKSAACADCGKPFSFRVAAAVLGANFRLSPRRCPACAPKHEARKALRCHWCGEVATHRGGDVIAGQAIGACSKPECRRALAGLMASGAARWADITVAEVGPDQAGFVDPYYDLSPETWGRRERR